MPSTDPQHLLSIADRQRLLSVNLQRPIRRLGQDCGYGRTVHRFEAPDEVLAALSDIELVDFADRSVVNHFGGKVERISPTVVAVTVWID